MENRNPPVDPEQLELAAHLREVARRQAQDRADALLSQFERGIDAEALERVA